MKFAVNFTAKLSKSTKSKVKKISQTITQIYKFRTCSAAAKTPKQSKFRLIYKI